MKSASIIITIDGPAASGKTSVSRIIASRHQWAWVSTGAFYRGLAYVATRMGISLEDEARLVQLCGEDFWKVQIASDRTRLVFKGEDCTDEIYKEANGNAASTISKFPLVREQLLDAQRRCALGVAGLVAEGRDCGTVVFPNAQLKIYITAGSEDRAKRRAKEEGRDLEEMRKAQTERDQQDRTRAAAPMQAADDAHIVDTSDMDLMSVVDHVESIISEVLNK